MSALETYLKAAKDARGMWHKSAIRTARIYIALSAEEDIITAIMNIEDPTLLRILWEVGLNARLQQAVLTKYNRITGAPMEVR